MATNNATNTSNPITVAQGGTGAATLTGILTGNGTSAVTANAVTQYGVVIAGASNAITSVAPSATTGVAVISQGAAANPAFGTVVVAGGGTGATTASAAATNLGLGTGNDVTFQSLTLSSSSTTLGTISSTDAGAGAGPIWDLYRNSASPAASDALGQIPFNGVNSTPAKKEYARIEGRIISTTASSEKGALALYTIATGTSTKQIDILDTGCQVRANNTNTAPPAGYIGEQLSTQATGTTALTNSTVTNITSVTLTPGNWDISGHINFQTTGSVTGNCGWEVAISTANNNLTAVDGGNYGMGYNSMGGTGAQPINGVASLGIIVGPVRVSISSNTTYYLNCLGTGSVTFTNVTGQGTIRAVREG